MSATATPATCPPAVVARYDATDATVELLDEHGATLHHLFLQAPSGMPDWQMYKPGQHRDERMQKALTDALRQVGYGQWHRSTVDDARTELTLVPTGTHKLPLPAPVHLPVTGEPQHAFSWYAVAVERHDGRFDVSLQMASGEDPVWSKVLPRLTVHPDLHWSARVGVRVQDIAEVITTELGIQDVVGPVRHWLVPERPDENTHVVLTHAGSTLRTRPAAGARRVLTWPVTPRRGSGPLPSARVTVVGSWHANGDTSAQVQREGGRPMDRSYSLLQPANAPMYDDLPITSIMRTPPLEPAAWAHQVVREHAHQTGLLFGELAVLAVLERTSNDGRFRQTKVFMNHPDELGYLSRNRWSRR